VDVTEPVKPRPIPPHDVSPASATSV
jgi:hypothetical protein